MIASLTACSFILHSRSSLLHKWFFQVFSCFCLYFKDSVWLTLPGRFEYLQSLITAHPLQDQFVLTVEENVVVSRHLRGLLQH